MWCNGHEIARRAALAEGIAVTPLANGFAATSDPARLQELCDMVQAGTLRVFFEYWMSRLPLPLTDADRDHGCWWELSMRQVEVSRTLVFDDPRRVRAVFEQLLAGNMNLGRPEHAEIIFAARVTRKTPGHLLHPAAEPRQPGHPQPVIPAFADQDVPEGRPRPSHRERDQ